MAYNYRNALDAIFEYLNVQKEEVYFIEDTNNRGFVMSNGIEDCVIFVSPIGCKQNNKQNWIDTRDSGVKERKKAWQYSIEHNLKFFFLCVNSEQERYKDYIFSLENTDESISGISYRKKDQTSGTGTQANIPNKFIPTKDFERFCTDKGFWFAVVKKGKVYDYLRYFDNRPYDDNRVYCDDNEEEFDEINKNDDSSDKGASKTDVGYNKIFYGIPGCGKSHEIEHVVLDGVDKENNVFRTTFYLDYSNSDFIGQIYPHVKDEKVTYEPIPGPFTKALERALSTDEMVYLVIEEINRGNAAAIFGDVFQLLDRLKEDKPDGRVVGDSEYPISNAFIEGYFDRVNEKAENADGVKKINFKKGRIIIPHNLTILATMNTSDQNVFPLDTAFKRRWDREKVVTEWSKVKNIKYMYIPCSSITWKQFVTTINQKMLQESQNGDVTISEDKQIGPYFVHESMLSATKNTGGKKELTAFVNNVLDYLYNDVTKFDHSILFDKKIYTYDTLYDLMEEYHYQGDKLFEVVFKDSVQKALEEAVNKDSTQEEPINTPEEEYADTEVESMEEPNE